MIILTFFANCLTACSHSFTECQTSPQIDFDAFIVGSHVADYLWKNENIISCHQMFMEFWLKLQYVYLEIAVTKKNKNKKSPFYVTQSIFGNSHLPQFRKKKW